jgi:uncharacterized protein YbbC (DUF1343 family)
MKTKFNLIILVTAFIFFDCSATNPPVSEKPELLTGAEQLNALLPKIKDKRVALVVNNTSLVGKTHLVDTLISSGVKIVKVFGPEHGFRGNAADGQHVDDSVDSKTGIPIFSLHGNNKKPSAEQLANVDVVIFDIQDVGARFYTYISTMHYVMEAAAEYGKEVIVLDRPNPNGNYVDGPIRKPEFKYFLAMHPIPIVHGLTVGELAQMINGEGWLEGKLKCKLTVIPLKNWTHNDTYSLPVRPSPNLPNDQSIKLYPSLCLFEQTVISVGRGTNMQFQVLGNPELKNLPFRFTPVSMPGISDKPPHQNKECYGIDLRNTKAEPKFDLSYLIKFYNLYPDKEKFFLKFFDNLAGTTELRKQIIAGLTEDQIRVSWQKELDAYKEMRKKYLLYP